MNSSVTFCTVLVNVFFRGNGLHGNPRGKPCKTVSGPVKPLQISFLEPRVLGQSTFLIPPSILRLVLYSDSPFHSRAIV